MHPTTLREAMQIFDGIKGVIRRTKKNQTIICPPNIYLTNLRKVYRLAGAQDVSIEKAGAHTGEVSAQMLKENGIDYVIIGHSERREMGETDEIVNRKIAVALEEKLKVILCVGESKRDEHGEYLTFLRNQLRNSLRRINRKYLSSLMIAYEPLFAVGRKDFQALSPHEIHQMVIFIRKNLVDHFADRIAERVPILYGGSVSTENAHEIVKKGAVDGLLIGRQSLNPTQFKEIIKLI